ncbi:bud site selection protein 20 [Sporothrix schenckii 1099-18]|uniref:C2H2-type domain-containing protein n=2 Tax=Sporothrix schenckii TaxID=29908 RepID=U7Q6J9_SPOS1|nr:bud site selection protein 20 [Sporothrix schenckii 1099-18]ERT02655.1 hypothetical protein HMPREF1624_00956 [Sporothrix schenckii ATCC 58251]KJR80041.1 bud site selection protein 20 [Sporothrix schenckii 1099-18]
MGTTNKKTLTKTRRKTRDVDEITNDLLSPAHLDRYKATKASEDLPGLGRHYCIACAKWFESDFALSKHQLAKPHKRRLKQLAEGAYTQREAEAAIGLHTDNGPQTKIYSKPLSVSTTGTTAGETEVAAPNALQTTTGDAIMSS